MEKSSKNEKQILFVIDKLEGGGAERQMLSVAELFKEEYNVTILSLKQANCHNINKMKALGFSYNFIDGPKLKLGFFGRTIGLLLKVRSLRRIIANKQPDKLVSFLEWSNVLSVIASRGMNLSVILNVRNYLTGQYGTRSKFLLKLATLIIGPVYNLSDRIVVNSTAIKQDLISNFNVNPTLINVKYNSYDIELLRFKSDQESGFKIDSKKLNFVFSGRLAEQKNILSLIKSFAEYARRSEVDVVLNIIGDGPQKGLVYDLIDKFKDDGQDIFCLHGHLANPHNLISQCDALVLHSKFEGFPNVIAESLIVGTPVVSIDCTSGPREILSSLSLIDYSIKLASVQELELGYLYQDDTKYSEVSENLISALFCFEKSGKKVGGCLSFLDKRNGDRLWLKNI
ncbi:glycosyltransferase [Shewanella sp. 125m-7]